MGVHSFKQRELIIHKLDSIIILLTKILEKEILMATELEALAILQTSVTEIQGAAASTVMLVQELSSYIRTHATNPQAILDYAAQLDLSANDLGAAVASNPVPPA